MSNTEQLIFAEFESSLDVAFWHQYNKYKLEVAKLSTDPVEIVGSYVNNQIGKFKPRLNLDYNAISRNVTEGAGLFSCPGVLYHTNTIEEYESMCSNSAQLLATYASEHIWQKIKSDEALRNPKILATFFMLTFGDLKAYNYNYWFAFPIFPSVQVTLLSPIKTLAEEWTDDRIDALLTSYRNKSNEVDSGFFILESLEDESQFQCHPLTSYKTLKEEKSSTKLCFCDPSTLVSRPAAILRNLLAVVSIAWPVIAEHEVLCLRQSNIMGRPSLKQSLTFKVSMSTCEITENLDQTNCSGWEVSPRSKKSEPMTLNLAKSMDPAKLSSEACNLTLQLMKWRVAPELDTDIFKSSKYLLLGAGTLGCNVARGLLGWGAKNITFVDCGKVSYSNPVRQSLYVQTDCLNGGKPKATTAAESLKLINPSVEAVGVQLSIPMPGHPPGEAGAQQVLADAKKLQDLVQSHNVVFLLTDSRESRWLPTLLASKYNKIAITAALGFDSYVVLRHGSKDTTETIDESAYNCRAGRSFPGSALGCYFCNDVIVPANSQKDRTLDQQCTVSRPGVSMMAAAQAVELMASILQHPLGINAPSGTDTPRGVLGTVPHSFRYFMSNYQMMTPSTPAFKECSACGNKILSAFDAEGEDLLLKVFNSSDYLEERSGLKELHQKCDEVEQVSDFSFDED